MRGGTGASIGSVVVAIALSQFLLAGDCTDGVTPDCSDAAAMCGPFLDASASQDATTPPVDASGTDAEPDAEVDGAADAGDG